MCCVYVSVVDELAHWDSRCPNFMLKRCIRVGRWVGLRVVHIRVPIVGQLYYCYPGHVADVAMWMYLYNYLII